MKPDELSVKTCPNCKRDIPEANFTVHTVHCQRSLVVCQKCKDAVPRTQLEEHMKNFHSNVQCPECRVTLEACDLNQHKSASCAKRLLKCIYCEIDLGAEQMAEHESYCGSRTERCDTCGQFVMIKDQTEHVASDHSSPLRHSEYRNNNNFDSSSSRMMNVTANDFPRESAAVTRRSYQSSPPTKRTNDMPQVNDVESVRNVRKETNKTQVAGLTDEQQRQNMEELDQMLAIRLAQEDQENEDDRLPYLLDDDRASRTVDPISLRSAFRNYQHPQPIVSEAIDIWQQAVNNPFDLGDDLVRSPLTSGMFEAYVPPPPEPANVDAEDGLPCEFCGELYPEDLLIQHQSGCRPDIAHGLPPTEEMCNTAPPVSARPPPSPPLSPPMFPPRALPPRSPPLSPPMFPPRALPPRVVPPTKALAPVTRTLLRDEEFVDTENVYNRESRVESDEDQNDIDIDMIPCEFCNDQFPSEVLMEHQTFCIGSNNTTNDENFSRRSPSPPPTQRRHVSPEPPQQPPQPQSPQTAFRLPSGGDFHRSHQHHVLRRPSDDSLITMSASTTTSAEVADRQRSQRSQSPVKLKETNHRQLDDLRRKPPADYLYQDLKRETPFVTPPPPRLHSTSQPCPRPKRVPIKVTSGANITAYGDHSGDSGVALSSPPLNKRLQYTVDAEGSSPALDSFTREVKKSYAPLRESFERNTANGKGTGTRSKLVQVPQFPSTRQNYDNRPSVTSSSFRDGAAVRVAPTGAATARVPIAVHSKSSDPDIPAHARSSDGSLEEAFMEFLNRRMEQPPTNRAAPPPSDRNGRLPPIERTGAVPKWKGVPYQPDRKPK